MDVTNVQRAAIELEQSQLHSFFPLFQRGVKVPAVVGCSLKSLLCDQFAIPDAYVTERITTIFFDNHPVDDLEQTIIQNGSRIALSAAMPGLVGATMRRGGFYAALRQGISQLQHDGATTPQNGTVTVKLFNLLLAELGPTLLVRGVLLEIGERDQLMQTLAVPQDSPPEESVESLLKVTFRE